MNGIHRAAAAVALSLSTSLALAQSETYVVDARHTFPTFEIEHFGLSSQMGRFNDTRGRIVLDRAARTGTIDVTISAASIDTGLEALEKQLRGEGFFNVEKHPTITYKANRVKFDGEKVVAVDGELTMLGVTRPVPLVVENFRCAPVMKRPTCGAQVSAVVRRSDFGLASRFAPPVLGQEVRLRFPVEAAIEQ